ncbi:MAG: hypothetical protein K0S53_412 [Bacteroidetes bacterium]|jgi:hypothetical protein|nr:hypothetical protein [Bacteroidota bacterium]
MNDSTSTFTHIVQVVGANVAALSITLSQINDLLTTLSLVLASSYTVYKLVKDLRKKKD